MWVTSWMLWSSVGMSSSKSGEIEIVLIADGRRDMQALLQRRLLNAR